MTEKELQPRRRELLFATRKSVRYHDYRRRHYLRGQSLIHFSGLILGSAAFAGIASGAVWSRWLPLAFAVLSAIGLVFRLGEKAALHIDLYKRFVRLEKRFLEVSDWTREDLDRLECEMLSIEADEPSIYSALNRQCHNEVLRSEGSYEYLQPLRWHHRFLKNWWDFDNLPLRA